MANRAKCVPGELLIHPDDDGGVTVRGAARRLVQRAKQDGHSAGRCGVDGLVRVMANANGVLFVRGNEDMYCPHDKLRLL